MKCKLKIVVDSLIRNVVKQALVLPRLRMNYNFHEDLGDSRRESYFVSGRGTVWGEHPCDTWHSLECLKSGTVLFEVK